VAQFGEIAAEHPLGVGVGWSGPAAGFRRDAETANFNSESEWNFLVVELGLAGLAVYLLLNLRLMGLSFTRIRRIQDPALRLNLAALAAPLVALVVAGFAGPTTASVPSAPYFWLVAGILSYWLAARFRTTGTPQADRATATAGPASHSGSPRGLGDMASRELRDG
jgi:hypothetical protein